MAMPKKRKRPGVRSKTLPLITPESMGELVTVDEIVAATKLSKSTVRRAYRSKELKGFIPTGRDPRRAGRMGYRFRKGDVLTWLYGAAAATPDPPADAAP